MVFHGDYEAEFEIYEVPEGEVIPQFLGYVGAVDACDAKVRWLENHEISPQRFDQIYALIPTNEWT